MPYCSDGHRFVHQAAKEVLDLYAAGTNKTEVQAKRSRNADPAIPIPPPKIITIPQTISHFVMNLPATATDFIPSYSGIYAGYEHVFVPHTEIKLPMVHAHCFSTKSDDNVREGEEITELVSKRLGVEMKYAGNCGPGGKDVMDIKDGEVKVHDVRDVAPLKRMFCASFRLPAEVAFRKM